MIRSPLYYSGDKYKVLAQIISEIPDDKRFVDLFLGGGSILANIENKEIVVNDLNPKLIELHKFIYNQKSGSALLKKVIKIADEFNLTTSYNKKYNISGDKKFFSTKNKESHRRLRDSYNLDKTPLKLLVLLIFSYNRLFRFNSNGGYNVPVGTLDLNKNAAKHIVEFTDSIINKEITFHSENFTDSFKRLKQGDVVFIDPPYLISNAEYNSLWTLDDEQTLYQLIVLYVKKGVDFIVTNYSNRNERVNETFNEWRKNYNSSKMESFYFSHHNNNGADFTEFMVTTKKRGK